MNGSKFSNVLVTGGSIYLWIIGLLVIVIGCFSIPAAIPAAVLLLILIILNVRWGHKRKKEITRYIETLTFHLDAATRETLVNFPLPLVVANDDGLILWYNSLFRELVDGAFLLDEPVSSVMNGIDKNEIESGKPKVVSIDGKNFLVLASRVWKKESDPTPTWMLYLVDVTRQVELEKYIEESRPVIGLIVIDNYDELMQNTEESSRAQMIAEIEGKVNQWASFTGGILKKFERDRFLFVFTAKDLPALKEKKFEILDIVKEINAGNKIPVTLSIGIGANAGTFHEGFNYASAAIDIALGRGGDQVVVKDGDKFSFYGGGTKELEKRTRVKARVIAHALRELMDHASLILIMGHENQDVDSLGAALGLYRVAAWMKKDAYIVLNRSNPSIERVLSKLENTPGYEGVFITGDEASARIDNRTLLIVVDTHRADYTEAPNLLKKGAQVVIVDHHRRSTDFIQDAVLTYHETYASSTCEMVTEIIQYIGDGIRLTPVEAEALYAGILLDTKNFTLKTGVRTFDAASFLKKQGMNTMSVKQFFQNDFQTYVSRSDVVRQAEIFRDRIAISVVPENVKNVQLIAAQAADELLSLSGISASFVLSRVGDEVWISGRSMGDINIQIIMEKLGGGGHLTSGGAQLKNTAVPEAKEKLKQAIEEYLGVQTI